MNLSVARVGFLRGGENFRGMCLLLLGIIFDENCMKMKAYWTGHKGRVPKSATACLNMQVLSIVMFSPSLLAMIASSVVQSLLMRTVCLTMIASNIVLCSYYGVI